MIETNNFEVSSIGLVGDGTGRQLFCLSLLPDTWQVACVFNVSSNTLETRNACGHCAAVHRHSTFLACKRARQEYDADGAFSQGAAAAVLLRPG